MAVRKRLLYASNVICKYIWEQFAISVLQAPDSKTPRCQIHFSQLIISCLLPRWKLFLPEMPIHAPVPDPRAGQWTLPNGSARAGVCCSGSRTNQCWKWINQTFGFQPVYITWSHYSLPLFKSFFKKNQKKKQMFVLCVGVCWCACLLQCSKLNDGTTEPRTPLPWQRAEIKRQFGGRRVFVAWWFGARPAGTRIPSFIHYRLCRFIPFFSLLVLFVFVV